MNTKRERTGFHQIYKILQEQKGIVRTADLVDLDIPTTYLSIMTKRGELERVAWGVYQKPTLLEDEFFLFQSQHKAAIFSHETALFLHDLSDRTPQFVSCTVPSGYHSVALDESTHQVFYVKRKLLEMGVVERQSPHGNPLRVTGMERTIVDILRSRNRIEDQILFDALKRYARLKSKNIELLYRYAERFRVQNILRPYMEVLL
jgi:predicted transcriptional regulator of viral defense system